MTNVRVPQGPKSKDLSQVGMPGASDASPDVGRTFESFGSSSFTQAGRQFPKFRVKATEEGQMLDVPTVFILSYLFNGSPVVFLPA